MAMTVEIDGKGKGTVISEKIMFVYDFNIWDTEAHKEAGAFRFYVYAVQDKAKSGSVKQNSRFLSAEIVGTRDANGEEIEDITDLNADNYDAFIDCCKEAVERVAPDLDEETYKKMLVCINNDLHNVLRYAGIDYEG